MSRFFLCLMIVVWHANCAESALIVSHAGSSDPTTEGWIADPLSGGVSVGSINDGGTQAWFVNDNSSAAGSGYFYIHNSSAAEIADGNSTGWTLSGTLRVATDENLSIGQTPFISYRDGINGWQMNFGLNSDGNTVVTIGTILGTSHTITGNSTYVDYDLVYDPISVTADFFVDGVEVISNQTGFATTETRVLWGAGSSPDQAQGNISAISFTTGTFAVPEPSSVVLFALGTAILCGARYRRRFRCSQTL